MIKEALRKGTGFEVFQDISRRALCNAQFGLGPALASESRWAMPLWSAAHNAGRLREGGSRLARKGRDANHLSKRQCATGKSGWPPASKIVEVANAALITASFVKADRID